MQFQISIRNDGKDYNLNVEQVFADERVERFKVTYKRASIVLESNRPLFRNKRLMSRRPNWSVVEGHWTNVSSIQKIQEAILKVVDN